MKPIAIFYHARLYGGEPPVDEAGTLEIMSCQMGDLKISGLAKAATELYVCLNAGDKGRELVGPILPEQAKLVLHGDQANTEVPTLHYLQKWLPGHEGWYVLYFHAKGARNTSDPLNAAWRGCMERVVIKYWERCIHDLDAGVDSVGCHFLTPERWGPVVREPYWGGNFWWCKSEILMTLPPIPQNMDSGMDYFTAERWFGWGKRPVVNDYHATWPGMNCANANL